MKTAALALVLAVAVAVPLEQQLHGSYTVSGLGQRKAAVKAAHGNDLSLSIAMLETNDMKTDYPYGDNKSGDEANFGIFKQNWAMLRQCCNKFKGQKPTDYNNGAALNSDLHADVTCLLECQQHYGLKTWFGGHRDGATGLANPNEQTVKDYVTGVDWIEKQVESQPHARTDDTRYWYAVTPI